MKEGKEKKRKKKKAKMQRCPCAIYEGDEEEEEKDKSQGFRMEASKSFKEGNEKQRRCNRPIIIFSLHIKVLIVVCCLKNALDNTSERKVFKKSPLTQ